MNKSKLRCNCWSETNDKLKEEGLKLQDMGALAKVGNKLMFRLAIPLVTLDGKKPKRGNPSYIWMDHCPFCGEEMKE